MTKLKLFNILTAIELIITGITKLFKETINDKEDIKKEKA